MLLLLLLMMMIVMMMCADSFVQANYGAFCSALEEIASCVPSGSRCEVLCGREIHRDPLNQWSPALLGALLSTNQSPLLATSLSIF
jgi:hypothetical protein